MRLIGLSVSGCIRDMAMGVVDEADVVCIIGGTDIRTVEDRNAAARIYRAVAWSKCQEKATRLFHYMMDTGKIIQPRLLKLLPVNVPSESIWAVQVDRRMLKTIRLIQQMEENTHGKD